MSFPAGYFVCDYSGELVVQAGVLHINYIIYLDICNDLAKSHKGHLFIDLLIGFIIIFNE